MKPMYHIGFDDSHKAKYAILPGDPGWVERIAALLDEPRFFHQNREYTTWLGKLEGENVLVMSTGMGGPSTAIGVEELCQTGVTTFIRVGTCGGMQLDVVGGDLVVATGAARGLACLGAEVTGCETGLMSTVFALTPEEEDAFPRSRAAHFIVPGDTLYTVRWSAAAKTYLRLVPEHPFGPPELCYCTETNDTPALGVTPYGQGRGVYIP